MKKKHMHKASDIQQHIDEPDDDNFNANEGNEKGTFTEEEYLNFKGYERSILLSVMEDQL